MLVSRSSRAPTRSRSPGASRRPSRAGARPGGHADRRDRLPAGQLHRDGDRQPGLAAADRAGCWRSLLARVFLFAWRTALIASSPSPLSLAAAGARPRPAGVTINAARRAGLVGGARRRDRRRGRRRRAIAGARRSAAPAGRGRRPARRAARPRSADAPPDGLRARSIVALAVLPVFFVEGVAGAFVAPLGRRVPRGAIAASLLVALTSLPGAGRRCCRASRRGPRRRPGLRRRLRPR